MSTVETHASSAVGVFHAAPWDYSRPALRLERLLRRNAVAVQTVFAVLWAVRLALVSGPWEVPMIAALIGLVCTRRAFRSTTGLRARDEFRTPRGRSFLRPVTRLTLWQVAASLALPVAAALVGLDGFGVPLVALTIGVFLVGFGRQLQLDAVRAVGAAATAGCVVPAFVATGDALVASVSLIMTLSLTASAVLCTRATA